MADTLELTDNQKLALKHFGKDVADVPAKTEDEIAAEKRLADEALLIEAKKKDDELAAEEEKKKTKTVAPIIEKVELTDAELLQLASKRAGREIKSWDDLKLSPTEEEKKKELENRDSDKLSFGLKQGLFNKKQYESFIADSKDPKYLVYSKELAEAMADDPTWDVEKEKEFKAEFDEKFGLELDPTSSKYKRGQKQIIALADSMLKKEYAPIYSLDDQYGRYEKEINTQKEQEQKLIAAAPAYKEDVTKVVAELSEIEMNLGEDKFSIPVPAESIQALTEVFLDNGFYSGHVLKGGSKEELKQIAKNYLLSQDYQYYAFEAAKKYRAKHEKGVRGIVPAGKLEQEVDQNENLTEQQKKALEFFKIKDKPVVAN